MLGDEIKLSQEDLSRSNAVVFFSPRGVESVRRAHLDLSGLDKVAIGATTAKAVERIFGEKVDAIDVKRGKPTRLIVASKPSPDGIRNAILRLI